MPPPVPYRHDLAAVHDSGFLHVARAAGPVLLNALRRRKLDQGLVIDLGCGSGVLAKTVSEAGYDVLGIDLSPAMVELARQRVPAARFKVVSLLKAELEPCVGVAAVGECCNYLFDETHSKAAVWRLFRRVHQALCPGGVFLFDLAGPGRVGGKGPVQKFVEGDGWVVLATTEEDQRRALLTRRITTFCRDGERFRRDDEVHQLRLFDPGQVVRQLRRIGFAVRRLPGYGPVRLPSGWAVFMARRLG